MSRNFDEDYFVDMFESIQDLMNEFLPELVNSCANHCFAGESEKSSVSKKLH